MRTRGLIIVLVAVAAAIVALIAFNGPLRPPSLDPQVEPVRTSAPPTAAAELSSPPPLGLHLDGLATVVDPNGLRLYQEPDGKKVKGVGSTIARGMTVFLDSERATGDGGTWWAVHPTDAFAYGWVQGADARGAATLTPLEPECPAADALDAATIQRIGTMTAFVCYGDDELTLRGQVTCVTAAIDSAIAGASWLPTNAVCDLDNALSLNGHVEETLLVAGASPQDPGTGRYEVTGHFDDTESRLCFTIPFGVSVSTPVNAPEPVAVVACRASFVVTSLTPIP